jgi:hypothetical protein
MSLALRFDRFRSPVLPQFLACRGGATGVIISHLKDPICELNETPLNRAGQEQTAVDQS